MTTLTNETEYVYSFSVWPDETWKWEKAVFDLFRMLLTRVNMRFTPNGFEEFRSSISHHGFTLREVERVPYIEPETVH